MHSGVSIPASLFSGEVAIALVCYVSWRCVADLEKCCGAGAESGVLVLSVVLQGLKSLIAGYTDFYRFYITLLVISTAVLLTGVC